MDLQPQLQLIQAARAGNAAGIAEALDAFSSLDSRAHAMGEALYEACRSGHASCARQLLAAGADPNFVVQREQRHWRPLHAAAGAGHVDCVAALLAAGACPLAVDHTGSLALHTARGLETTLLLLREAPQAALMQNSNGTMPVQTAIAALRTDEAQCLVAEGPLLPPSQLIASVVQVLHTKQYMVQQEQLDELALVVPLLAARAGLQPIVEEWRLQMRGAPLKVAAHLAIWLPAMLRHSDAAAGRLVQLLPQPGSQRLRTLVLCLGHIERSLSAPLPAPIVHHLLAECAVQHALAQPRRYGSFWRTRLDCFATHSQACLDAMRKVFDWLLFAAVLIVLYALVAFVLYWLSRFILLPILRWLSHPAAVILSWTWRLLVAIPWSKIFIYYIAASLICWCLVGTCFCLRHVYLAHVRPRLKSN